MNVTKTEKKVLEGLASGRTGPEVAEGFMVSKSAVRFHVESLMIKFGVTTRVALVREAVRSGAIEESVFLTGKGGKRG